MADNKQIKDGLGNLFTVRMRDISDATDGSYQRSMVLANLCPVDYGSVGGGSYHRGSKSGVMVANLAAASPIYAFRWSSASMYALLKRVRISVWSQDVGFTAGIAIFDLLIARPFTVQLTGGYAIDFSGNMAKLRSSMASSQASVMRSTTTALTGGTYTFDGGPGVADSWASAVTTTPYTPILASPIKLFEKPQGEMPLALAKDEGFIVQATVPQTGTWSFVLIAEWDEVPLHFGY
jgi:hypothetical protein